MLVSDAGICPFHDLLDMQTDVLERTMCVNLHNAYLLVQADRMVHQAWRGAIVAISSISALVGGEFPHYTPTNAGDHSLMQSVAIAIGRYRNRCNSVLPGTILTDINADDLADAVKCERMITRTPLGHLGQPDDVAAPIIFLASHMARHVTGAALLVDGVAYVNLQ
ncbi:SDR family oxidoreductase [Sphingomonas yunnanensis]|nr:SDR family oxidoreductase [Sphingomonas yunnanensis]